MSIVDSEHSDVRVAQIRTLRDADHLIHLIDPDASTPKVNFKLILNQHIKQSVSTLQCSLSQLQAFDFHFQ